MQTTRNRSRRRRFAGAFITILVLVAATAAYAYFTAGGTGSGTASVGTDAGVQIQDVAFDGTLYPGKTVGVSFTVANLSADSPAKVGQVVSAGITGLPAGCSAADFTYTPGARIDTDIAASGSTAGAGTLTFANTAANQDACKGAQPVLNLVVDNAAI